MKAERAYEKFQMKVNDNFETAKIAVDRGRFVILINEAQNKMVEAILDRKQNDEIRYIQKLLIKDNKIPKTKSTNTLDYFLLPTNYFDFSSAYSLATQNNCKDKRINLEEIKDDNSIDIFSDEYSSPSFLARESFFTFTEDSLAIFKNDFSNTFLFLSYYRYPQQIKLVDEENPESVFDDNFELEFDDKFCDRIISMASSEHKINNDEQSFQINKQQAINKI